VRALVTAAIAVAASDQSHVLSAGSSRMPCARRWPQRTHQQDRRPAQHGGSTSMTNKKSTYRAGDARGRTGSGPAGGEIAPARRAARRRGASQALCRQRRPGRRGHHPRCHQPPPPRPLPGRDPCQGPVPAPPVAAGASFRRVRPHPIPGSVGDPAAALGDERLRNCRISVCVQPGGSGGLRRERRRPPTINIGRPWKSNIGVHGTANGNAPLYRQFFLPGELPCSFFAVMPR
jgi:hypothetical protein